MQPDRELPGCSGAATSSHPRSSVPTLGTAGSISPVPSGACVVPSPCGFDVRFPNSSHVPLMRPLRDVS